MNPKPLKPKALNRPAELLPAARLGFNCRGEVPLVFGDRGSGFAGLGFRVLGFSLLGLGV